MTGESPPLYPRTMVLTADHLKSVLRRFHDRLAHHREALNRLNVYPVPDGDTGTNMALTLEAVMAEVDQANSMGEVAEAMAHGSLMGARGNSGIILSQILRGLSDRFADCESLGTHEIAEALTSASEAAYLAVMRPVEGTILTVVREAAGAARATGTEGGTDVAAFLDRVYRRGLEALERTPELLPVLHDAGVVDAGGAGLLLLLASFVEAGANQISVHQETCPHLERTLRYIQQLGAKAGVVLNPATSLRTLDYVLDAADFVLLMTVNPGFGGQQFIPPMVDKIRELDRIRKDRRLGLKIEIDGGVSSRNIGELTRAGVDWFVAGSSVFNGPDPAAAIKEMLRIAAEATAIRV